MVRTIFQHLCPRMLGWIVELNARGLPLDIVMKRALWFNGLDTNEFASGFLRNINGEYQLIRCHTGNLCFVEVWNEGECLTLPIIILLVCDIDS